MCAWCNKKDINLLSLLAPLFLLSERRRLPFSSSIPIFWTPLEATDASCILEYIRASHRSQTGVPMEHAMEHHLTTRKYCPLWRHRAVTQQVGFNFSRQRHRWAIYWACTYIPISQVLRSILLLSFPKGKDLERMHIYVIFPWKKVPNTRLVSVQMCTSGMFNSRSFERLLATCSTNLSSFVSAKRLLVNQRATLLLFP